VSVIACVPLQFPRLLIEIWGNPTRSSALELSAGPVPPTFAELIH